MRFSQKIMLTWSLRQSTKKPKSQTFLQQFVEDLLELKDDGMIVDLNGQDVTVHAELSV